MRLKMTDDEDKFLSEKYSEYRNSLRESEACTEFMPYGWFKPPETIKLDSEFGRQQMIYRDVADDAARDLANGINHLINLTRRLDAWHKVIAKLDVHGRSNILHEFVQDLASTALLMPYTLKARFYFAVAHLSHQANSTGQGVDWSDDFATLPEDWGINEEAAVRLARPWRSWKKLIKALNTVDMRDYKTATDDFRSKHTHRSTPQVELGITQMVRRLPSKPGGKPYYGVGGSEPIQLEILVREVKGQCVRLSKCYCAFRMLVAEQGKALFGTACECSP
jgi:hypothetical protein